MMVPALIFPSARMALRAKERAEERRSFEATRCALLFLLLSSLSFLSYRGSNQPKESSCRSCPFGRLHRSSADSSILSDPPRCQNVLLLFLFLSLLQIPRSHSRFFPPFSSLSEGEFASDTTYAEKFTKSTHLLSSSGS